MVLAFYLIVRLIAWAFALAIMSVIAFAFLVCVFVAAVFEILVDPNTWRRTVSDATSTTESEPRNERMFHSSRR